MKKYGSIALALILALAMSGCRRDDGSMDPVPPQTASSAATFPSTEATTPFIDPTMGTNIPDPTVDSNSTDYIYDGMTEESIGGTTGNTTPSTRSGIRKSK